MLVVTGGVGWTLFHSARASARNVRTMRLHTAAARQYRIDELDKVLVKEENVSDEGRKS